MGFAAAVITWFVWGSLQSAPRWHDEAAYLLQAEIFASGRIAGEARPLLHFFDQMHVFSTPTLLPKYPPAHALTLVPGLLVGLTGLGPVVFAGLAGGMLFLWAERVAGTAVATISGAVWLVAPMGLMFRASYLSHATTTLCWIVAFWSLQRWRATHGRRYLFATAVSAGWCVVARPVTGVVLTCVLLVAVLPRIGNLRLSRQLVWALAAGAVAVSVVPLWNLVTMGSLTVAPYVAYADEHLPFDRYGFGLADTSIPPGSPPDVESFSRFFQAVHQDHTVSALPSTLHARLTAVARGMWGSALPLLLTFAVAGLVYFGRSLVFPLLAAVLLWLAHVPYAHDPRWTVYYLEATPIFAILTGAGAVRSWRVVREMRTRNRPVYGALVIIGGFAAVVAAWASITNVPEARAWTVASREVQEQFLSEARSLPHERVVVFVRYAPSHDPHVSLVRNPADLHNADVWVVYDRPAEACELLEIADTRVPYRYDEASDTFVLMTTQCSGGVVPSQL